VTRDRYGTVHYRKCAVEGSETLAGLDFNGQTLESFLLAYSSEKQVFFFKINMADMESMEMI
jgi:hypothetical protein